MKFHDIFSGTAKERGLVHLLEGNHGLGDADNKSSSVYEIPLLAACIRKTRGYSYIPVCPTYKGLNSKCSRRHYKVDTVKGQQTHRHTYVTKMWLTNMELSIIIIQHWVVYKTAMALVRDMCCVLKFILIPVQLWNLLIYVSMLKSKAIRQVFRECQSLQSTRHYVYKGFQWVSKINIICLLLKNIVYSLSQQSTSWQVYYTIKNYIKRYVVTSKGTP